MVKFIVMNVSEKEVSHTDTDSKHQASFRAMLLLLLFITLQFYIRPRVSPHTSQSICYCILMYYSLDLSNHLQTSV